MDERTVKGDFEESGDTVFSVETYDDGSVLLTVGIAGETYPVELRNDAAIELGRQLYQSATEQ